MAAMRLEGRRHEALSVIHYKRGRTSHSVEFGIPVQRSDEGLESRIRAGSAHAELLRQAR
jgi:hypothetical protein